jgi:hypothetical protein
MVNVELQGQLLTWERELDSQEGAIITWEEALATFAHRLERCARIVTLVTPVPMPCSGTSSPRRVPPVPGLNSSPTMV